MKLDDSEVRPFCLYHHVGIYGFQRTPKKTLTRHFIKYETGASKVYEITIFSTHQRVTSSYTVVCGPFLLSLEVKAVTLSYRRQHMYH